MIDFLVKYWPLLADGFILILSIVLFILSKHKKISSSIVSDAISYIYRILPELIKATEQLGLVGSEKKEIVLRAILDVLANFLHRSLTSDEEIQYRMRFSDAIEEILSTPTKKGI